jgi:hypothetical protein
MSKKASIQTKNKMAIGIELSYMLSAVSLGPDPDSNIS